MSTPVRYAADGFVVVDLSPYLNNVGTSLPGTMIEGGIDGMNRTLPTEEMGPIAAMTRPIVGWGRGSPDNVMCDEQLITLPTPVAASGWSIVGVARGGPMRDTFTVVDHFGLRITLPVGLSDMVSRVPAFDDTEAVVFSGMRGNASPPRPVRLWRADHAFEGTVHVRQIELPLNPDMHVFAIVLQPSSGGIT